MDRDPFTTHVCSVETLAMNGVLPPKTWNALRAKFAEYVSLERPMLGRLAAAIADPASASDVAQLRALAFAEQSASSVDQAAVADTVRGAVYAKLVAAYAPVRSRNYKTVAEQFDALADEFTKCAKFIDPETDSDMMLRVPDAARAAWFRSAELAQQLTEYTPVLAAAASLAGAPGAVVSPLADEAGPLLLPLCCDPKKTHRREVWTAFNTSTGRTARWGALHKLGVTLRAAGNPQKIVAYRPPQPLQSTWVPGPYGGYVREVVDPETTKVAVGVGDADWSVD